MNVYKEHIQLIGLVVMLSGSSLLAIGMVVSQVGNELGNALLIPSAMVIFFVGMVAYAFSAFMDTLYKEIEEIKKGDSKW